MQPPPCTAPIACSKIELTDADTTPLDAPPAGQPAQRAADLTPVQAAAMKVQCLPRTLPRGLDRL
jgi:hypothetical protein